MLDLNKVYNIDILDGLSQLDDNSIDFIFADFPYNISGYSASVRVKNDKCIHTNFGDWDIWNSLDEYFKWCLDILKEFSRVSKENASYVCFFDSRLAGHISYLCEESNIAVYKSPLIWKKINPYPSTRKTGFRSSLEHGVWLINNPNRYIGNPDIVIKPRTFNFLDQRDMCNVMDYAIGCNKTSHPNEKPIQLVARVVSIFTDEGGVVLDPFMGSGTTGVAALQLGRKYIGFEKDVSFYNECLDRISKQACFTNLF